MQLIHTFIFIDLHEHMYYVGKCVCENREGKDGNTWGRDTRRFFKKR